MPDSQGKIRGIAVPDVPWHQDEQSTELPFLGGWSQQPDPDGSLTRVYHEPAGDRTVILDPKAKDES